MRKIKQTAILLSFILLFGACSKNEGLPDKNQLENLKLIGQFTFPAGSLPATARTATVELYYMKADASQEAQGRTPLTINNGGVGEFNYGLPLWFDKEKDLVAGTIYFDGGQTMSFGLTKTADNYLKPEIMPDTKLLTGSADLAEQEQTRAYIGGWDADINLFRYVWSKTPTKPLTVYFEQASGGTNKASASTTLVIDARGNCRFTVPAPTWFTADRDFIAGAIDVAATTSTPGEWSFLHPGVYNATNPRNNVYTIDAKGETYLPMFFPRTKATTVDGTIRVNAQFQTLGSIVAVIVENVTGEPYELTNFYLRSRSFRLGGTTTWDTPTAEGKPGWRRAEPIATDSFRTFKIENLTVPPREIDTFYVWVHQSENFKGRRLLANVSQGADSLNRAVFYRPTTPTMEDNKVYKMNLSVGRPSELLITEVAGPTRYSGGIFLELYNGTDAAIQLNEYFMWEQVARSWDRLPTYTLDPGKLVVLASPPPNNDMTQQGFRDDIAYITGPIIYLNRTIASNWSAPMYQRRNFVLTKYLPDYSMIIDRASGTGNPSFNWNNYGGMKRNQDVLYPRVQFDYTRWTPYGAYTGDWWGTADTGYETLGER